MCVRVEGKMAKSTIVRRRRRRQKCRAVQIVRRRWRSESGSAVHLMKSSTSIVQFGAVVCAKCDAVCSIT